MAEHRTNVTITAKDKASRTLLEISRLAASLDDEPVEITVDAKIEKVLAAMDSLATETAKAREAADALGAALGPELAARADLDEIVDGFRRADLSLDDIIANAERLGSELRGIGERTGIGLDDSLARSRRGFDDLGRAAGNSRQVLGNFVGNAAQDIGRLAGVSGSAGVAISQMAESMTDAALSGQKLTKVVGGFGKVAAPAAIVAAAIAALTHIVGEQAEAAEEAAEAIEQYRSALSGSGDATQALLDNLEPTIERLREFKASLGGGFWESLLDGVEGVLGALPIVGDRFDDLAGRVNDVIPTLEKAGVTAFELSEEILHGSTQLGNQLDAALASGIITLQEYADAWKAVAQERDRALAADEAEDFFRLSADGAAHLIDQIRKSKSPLDFYQEHWQTIIEAMRNGTEASAETAAAMQFLDDNLPLDSAQITVIALEEIARQDGETTKAIEENAKRRAEAFKEGRDSLAAWTKEFLDHAAAVHEATAQIAAMGEIFPEIGRREEALARVFKLGQGERDFAANVRDIGLAIGALNEDLKDIEIGDVLAGSVKADKFLDAIDKLAPDIQAAIVSTFGTGGPEAAVGLANSYIDQITTQLAGAFTRQQIAELLGLDHLEVIIHAALDQKSLDDAQHKLDILTRTTESPYTATIDLALRAGDLTPDVAQALIDAALRGQGVVVPVNPEISKAEMETAKKFARDTKASIPLVFDLPRGAAKVVTKSAQTDLDAEPKAKIHTEAEAPTNLETLLHDQQVTLNKEAPLLIPTMLAAPRNKLDGGGTAGGYGALAGERRPEILNGKYLITSPTWVPPGTRVTSGARTARILRTRGTRGLRRYDSGGSVPAGPVTVNVNAAVIGNRFDVMRAVKRANLDRVRLLGTRG